MSKVGWFGLLVVAVVVGSCNAALNDDDADTTSSAASTAAAPAPPSFAAPTVAPAAEPVGEQITVARVIDGDTFELADGRKVRVLGIDSCEMDTYGGGEAKLMAESDLTNPYNQPITLTVEPGAPDTDRYGRLLRYVGLNGGDYDFGEQMVKYDHTGVYQGDNDASAAYLERLYAADLEYAQSPPSGRECADPYAEYRDDVDVHVDVDNDDHDRGLPDGALTGGYCARKWWC